MIREPNKFIFQQITYGLFSEKKQLPENIDFD